jgi:hypothetical protein
MSTFITPGSGASAPSAVVVAEAGTLDTNVDINASWLITLGADITLAAPTMGAEGTRVLWKFTASEADRAVTLASAFKVPASSSLASPFTVASGKTTVFMAEKMGDNWLIESYIPGY